jgi:hypothetical protein
MSFIFMNEPPSDARGFVGSRTLGDQQMNCTSPAVSET